MHEKNIFSIKKLYKILNHYLIFYKNKCIFFGMSNEEKVFYEKMRMVRRMRGMTQMELARKAGCKQSAISMYEAGHTDALSRKNINEIADILGISDLPDDKIADFMSAETKLRCLKYCPVDDCPSNIPYIAGGELHFKPTMVSAFRGETVYCQYCGEVLQESCPNEECGALAVEGGFCRYCGDSYVTVTQRMRGPLDEWVSKRCEAIKELRSMSETIKFSA